MSAVTNSSVSSRTVNAIDVRGGHAEDRIGRLDAPEDLTGAGVSGTDGSPPGCRGRHSGCAQVQPQTCLALRSVRPMAGETTVGQQGLDVPSEVNRLGAGHGKGKQDAETRHPQCPLPRPFPEHRSGPCPRLHYALRGVARSLDVPFLSGTAAGGVQCSHAHRKA